MLHTLAYVSIRQHTSAYVSIRQHMSAYVSIRQHTSAYVSQRCVERGTTFQLSLIHIYTKLSLIYTYTETDRQIDRQTDRQTRGEESMLEVRPGEGLGRLLRRCRGH